MADDNIDLGEALQKGAADEFWAIRGHAIQGYANLEQSLCHLLSLVSGMSFDVAAVVFFKITSADSRNKILDKLIRMKYGTVYGRFWNSFFKAVHGVDRTRNEIVHWNVVSNVSKGDDGETRVRLSLNARASIYITDSGAHTLSANDLVAFMEECSFYTRLSNMFFAVMGLQGMTDADKQPWLKVFSEPIVYPAPAGHPILG